MNKQSLSNKICSLYLFLMFTIPLFIFNDYYYDITITKYKAFAYITSIFLLIILIVSVCLLIKQKRIHFDIKIIKKYFNTTDICVIVFAFICALSTMFSTYPSEAWDGSLGRYMGLFSMLLCVGIYFAVSRLYKLQQSILLIFLISIFFVELLGLLNYFSVDIFGFYDYVSDYQSNLYISTIGNVNFFAALACLSLPMCSVFYCVAKERLSTLIYFVLTAMNFVAVLISNSDGAHIATVVLLLTLGIYTMKQYDYFKKYLHLLAIYFVSAKVLGCITIQTGTGHYLHTVSSVLAYHPFIYVFLIIIALVYIFMIWKKDIFKSDVNMKMLKRIFSYYIVIGSLLFLIILILYNMNVINIPLPYIENYLKFDHAWGTGRGEIWNMVLEAWNHQPFLQKIIGIGPDALRPVLFDFYQNADILAYDNAHNELIQYMVTTGILGVICYIGIHVSLIKHLFSYRYQEPFAFALLCMIVCYLIQSLFNIAQPITTPLLFMFLGISESFLRDEAKQRTESNEMK